MISIFKKFFAVTDFLSPFADLGLRLWIANIFWKSGVLKTRDWDITITLFTEEHPIPNPFGEGIVNPQFAAFLGVGFELLCPFLLVIGLGSRFATVPLLIMTAVIQFTYQSNIEHLLWTLILVTILLKGPGRFSIDHFIKAKYMPKFSVTESKLNLWFTKVITSSIIMLALYSFGRDVFSLCFCEL